MTEYQLCRYIKSLIDLENRGRLSDKDKKAIRDILYFHNFCRSGETDDLFCIIDDLTPGQIKKIARILISHRVPVRCSVCGGKIKKPLHATVEHDIPRTHGGTNKRECISISHNYCNNRKGDSINWNCVPDNPDEVAIKFAMSYSDATILVRMKASVHVSIKPADRNAQPATRTRPARECNHAATWDSAKVYRHNVARLGQGNKR